MVDVMQWTVRGSSSTVLSGEGDAVDCERQFKMGFGGLMWASRGFLGLRWWHFGAAGVFLRASHAALGVPWASLAGYGGAAACLVLILANCDRIVTE